MSEEFPVEKKHSGTRVDNKLFISIPNMVQYIKSICVLLREAGT